MASESSTSKALSTASGYARSEASSTSSRDTSGGDYMRRSPLTEQRDRRIDAWVQGTVDNLGGKAPGADGSRLPKTDLAERGSHASPKSTASTAFYSARSGQGPASVAGSDVSSSSFYSAASRQSEGGMRSNIQKSSYEPSGSMREPQQAAAAKTSFSYGPRQAAERSAQLETGRAAPSGQGFKLHDPNRSWAGFGAQAAQALSTPQGRQQVMNDISHKAWGAAQSWSAQAANANTPAKQPQQMERPALPERNRDMAALSR